MRHLIYAFEGMGRKGNRRYHRFALNAHAVANMAGMSQGRRMATFSNPIYIDPIPFSRLAPGRTRPENTYSTQNLVLAHCQFNDIRPPWPAYSLDGPPPLPEL